MTNEEDQMSKIDDLSKNVDQCIREMVGAITAKGYKRLGVDRIAEAIDAYRAEVAKEIEGLNSHASAMTKRGDNYTSALAAANREIEGLKGDVKSAEAAYEACKARQDRLVNSVVGPHSTMFLNAGEPLYAESDITQKVMGVDLAAPGETDKTVLTWTCCNVTHSFTAPRGVSWTHNAECHECGSKTSIYP